MKTYTFLKNRHKQDETIFAISEDRIENLRVSKTYDRFGQIVGTYIAGDSVELLTQKAVEIAQKIAEEQEMDYSFKIGDYVNGYDDNGIYDEIEEALESEAIENEDYSLYFETCKGFDYWDGNNWKTITTYSENDQHEYGILDDEITKELNEAINKMEFISKGYGRTKYQTEKYNIEQTQFASDWSVYRITERQE